MQNVRSTSEYEWDAEAYHAMSDPQFDVAMDLLESLGLVGDETIIDTGCGSGRVSVEILQRLPRGHLIAVDLSHNMLEFAEKVLVAQPGQKVDVVHADLQTFVRPNSADGIFSSSTLHFVRDHLQLFENMMQSLKPHSWIALQFGAANMVNNAMLKEIHDLVKGPTFGQYNLQLLPEFYGVSGDATYRNLQSAGFVEIVVEETDVVMDFAHDHRMERMMRSALNHDVMSVLPSDSVREDLLRQLAAILNNDAVMREPMTLTRAHARSPRVM